MKSLLNIFFIFITFICFGQKGSDSWAKIPEKIQNEKEIRIYKNYTITNGGEIFRIYFQNNKWNAEIIKWNFPQEISDHEFQTIEPRIAKLKVHENDFMEFELRNIAYLPHEKSFQYKKEKGEIIYDEDLKENVILTKKMMIMDGTIYEVKYKNGNIINNFTYSNPKSYLKNFPEINELNYFVDILNFIKEKYRVEFSN